jgi:transposase
LPKPTACPDCGGVLKPLGEDVAEMLEWVPASFKVIRLVRPKRACGRCDKIVQAEAPSRPIARGLADPGLLAHVLVSKYCDYLPLYRQAEMCAREGVELDRGTLAGWVGETSRLLEPLVEALRRHGENDPVGNQVGGHHPGGFISRSRQIAGNVRQRHIDYRAVEHLHEGGQHHGNGDDPRAARLSLYRLTRTADTADTPGYKSCSGSWPFSNAIFTGTRCGPEKFLRQKPREK